MCYIIVEVLIVVRLNAGFQSYGVTLGPPALQRRPLPGVMLRVCYSSPKPRPPL